MVLLVQLERNLEIFLKRLGRSFCPVTTSLMDYELNNYDPDTKYIRVVCLSTYIAKPRGGR